MSSRLLHRLRIVLIALLVLFCAGGLFAQGRSHEAFQRVSEVQERHTLKLMAQRGIVGTALTGDDQGGLAILILTEHAGVAGIPQTLDGVPTRVMRVGLIEALKPPTGKGKPGSDTDPPTDNTDPTTRFDRPVPIGISVGHEDITAGTIGCRVSRGTDVYILSNNHVLANANSAVAGDLILQPGPYDGGTVGENCDDCIAILSDWIPLDFSGLNTVDAAIAAPIIPGDLGNGTPSNGYGTPKSNPIDAVINMSVQKYGRTTGLTKGRVAAFNANVNVDYGSGVAFFTQQIIITPGSFSAGGDSGSLVVAEGKGRDRGDDRAPVGLLFAGSDTVTIANPIQEVLTALNVSIDGD